MIDSAAIASHPAPSRNLPRTVSGLRLSFCLLVGVLSMIAADHRAVAQDDSTTDVPLVTKTVAIRNARVVQAPGRILEHGTIVMRNGLITAVGRDVEIPYDADVIEGDSLTVYAGFVDGLSHAALPESERERGSDPVNSAEPPPELAGIQPHVSAREHLEPAHESVDAIRRLGFTVAHVVPYGRMLPGSGSIVLLTGEKPVDMVLRPDVSLFLQFVGGPGVYPATAMGVMARLRQLYREAERRRSMELHYADNPAGMDRPSYDPIHQALYPVISREKPLFVAADGSDGALEVHRALQLRDELGFSLSLADLGQGFDVVGALKEAAVPLFLTLGLPKKPDEHDADSTAVDTVQAVTPESSHFVSDLRTHTYLDVDRERDNLIARKALSRRRYVETALKLHEAGLRFGFSTRNVKPEEIRENVREMIDAGLPEDAALAALTIDGARLLGIDRNAGTIEAGKLANLVVTKGSYFGDGDDPVRHVFVDGRRYDYEEDEDDATIDAQRQALAGTWNLTIQTPDGESTARMALSVTDDAIKGRVTSSELMQPADLVDASFENGHLSFSLDTSEHERISAELDVTGDTLTGTINVPGTGVLEVTGSKAPEN